MKKAKGLGASLRRKSLPPPRRVWAILNDKAVRLFSSPLTLGGKEEAVVMLRDVAFVVPTEDDDTGTSFTLACEPLGANKPDVVLRVDYCHPRDTPTVRPRRPPFFFFSLVPT